MSITFKFESAAQINLHPNDLRYASYILPHQVRVWAPMVERVVVTIDTHNSKSGRYRNRDDFDTRLRGLIDLVDDVASRGSNIERQTVDYAPAHRRDVARAFFGIDDLPIKAWDGGPFHSYFSGMQSTDARYVVHMDGDMLYGGGSRTWLREAICLLDRDPTLLFASPLPGPPRHDGKVFGHGARPETPVIRNGKPVYLFSHLSTRIFVLDRQRLHDALGTFSVHRPDLKRRVKARFLGHPPIARDAEVVLGKSMRSRGLGRVDFLGDPPGMWSLHPPYRNEEFYTRLPELIDAVENDRVPEEQRGHYDMVDAMVDWSEVRSRSLSRRRYLRMLRDRVGV